MQDNAVKYWVIPIYDMFMPEPIVGPFDSFDEMKEVALSIAQEQDETDDGIFYLKIDSNGKPSVHSFDDEFFTMAFG